MKHPPCFKFNWSVAILLGAFPALAATAESQEITVGVKVDERAESVVGAEFINALELLPGISVGTTSSPDYLIRLSVTCSPDASACDSTPAYAVAVTLSQPLAQSVAADESTGAVSETLQDPDEPPVARRRPAEVFQAIWTESFSADTYRDRIAEVVADMDRRCFAMRRLLLERERAQRASDDDAVADLDRRLRKRGGWMCR